MKQSDLITVAKHWLEAGYSVIPVRADKVAIGKWGIRQETPYTPTQLEVAFQQPNAERIAVVAGYHGLVCFDFDPDKQGRALEAFDIITDFYLPWLETAHQLGITPAVQTTQSGGRHAVIRCPHPLGSAKLANVPAAADAKGQEFHTTVETRGAGGYFVLHELTLDPSTIPAVTQEQYEALLEAAAALDRLDDGEAPQRLAQAKRGTGEKANATRRGLVGWFNERHTVQEVLQRNGYKRIGDKYLSPTSSSGNAGVTIFEDDAGFELCFSHHSDVLGDGHAHDAFDTFKLIEHNGDFHKAKEAVEKEKGKGRFTFGPPEPQGSEATARHASEAKLAAAMRSGLSYQVVDGVLEIVIEAAPADLSDLAAMHKNLSNHPRGLSAKGETAVNYLQHYFRLLNGNMQHQIRRDLPELFPASETSRARATRGVSSEMSTNASNAVTDATTICAHPMSTNQEMSTKEVDLSSNPQKDEHKSNSATNPVQHTQNGFTLTTANDLCSNDEHKQSSRFPSEKTDLCSNKQPVPTREATEPGIQRWGDRARPPDVQWLVHHLIQDNAENLIAGEPGVGKSWVSGDLAVAVATGSAFLDRHTKQGPVLIINFDDPSESLPRMFAERAARGRSYNFAELDIFYWQPEENKPYPPEGIITPDTFEFLKAEIQRLKPRLIIVDAYSSAFPNLDGNKGQDVIVAFEALRQLRNAAPKPCTMILIDHTPKATMQDSKRRGVSGSQQKHAKTRTVHIIRTVDPGDVNGDDVLEWEVFKANAAPRQEAFGVDRQMNAVFDTATLTVRSLPERGTGAKNDRAAKTAITFLRSRAGETVPRKDLLAEIVALANISMATARRGLDSNEFLDHPQIRVVQMGGRGNPQGFLYEPDEYAGASLYERFREVLRQPDTPFQQADLILEYFARADAGDDDAKDRIDEYLRHEEVRNALLRSAPTSEQKGVPA